MHWTYEPAPPDTDLQQGDLLLPTDDLKTVFAAVHRHFCDDKYLAFLVTTQSCDLVRRGASSKAVYINLSTVRPLSKVLDKLLAHTARPLSPGVFRRGQRGGARQLLERVLNQNEQALGLFYLHADADVGIGESAVAFLRVTVALRSEHYEVLRQARQGSLKSEFRAKLGWLIGNLYGRPATPDWADAAGGDKAFDALISKILDEFRWLDDVIVDEAQKQGIDLKAASDAELEILRPPPPIERALDEVQAELTRLAPTTDAEVIRKLRHRLRSNAKFQRLVR